MAHDYRVCLFVEVMLCGILPQLRSKKYLDPASVYTSRLKQTYFQGNKGEDCEEVVIVDPA
jgi:hypothetical protein